MGHPFTNVTSLKKIDSDDTTRRVLSLDGNVSREHSKKRAVLDPTSGTQLIISSQQTGGERGERGKGRGRARVS